MKIQRGDIVLVRFPFTSGAAGKVRPGLVVQNDRNNHRLTNTILALVTSVTQRSHEPTQLLVEIVTPDGVASGLLFDSAVKCEHLATVEQRLIQRKIGALPVAMMSQVDQCLKLSLGI